MFHEVFVGQCFRQAHVVRPDIRQILGQDSALRVNTWGQLHTCTFFVIHFAPWGLELLCQLLNKFDGCA
jgi:hypothetical protein